MYNDVTVDKIMQLIEDDNRGNGVIGRRLKDWLNDGGHNILDKWNQYMERGIDFERSSVPSNRINKDTGEMTIIREPNEYLDKAHELRAQIQKELDSLFSPYMGIDLSTQTDKSVTSSPYSSKEQIKELHVRIEKAARLPKGFLFGNWDYKEGDEA